MMLNFVGAGSPTIIAPNLQSHKPASACVEHLKIRKKQAAGLKHE